MRPRTRPPLCLFGLLLVWVSSDQPLPGADGPAAPPGNHRPTFNEIEVTMRVRQALLLDPELKGLNFFIRVQAGVATLKGPVPSAELSRKVENVVRQVRGVYEVVNRLDVVAPEPKPFVMPLNPDPPVHTESARPVLSHAPSGILAGRMPRELPFNPEAGVTLLPPVVGTNPASPPRLLPLLADPVETLRERIDQVRRENSRYRSIQVEVRDGQTLWVHDDPYHGDDVAALAARLRRVPGVRMVLIKNASSQR